jgi:hypothetical protein
MAKLIEGGLEVTAVHNHLLRAEPLTFYMHVGGHGDPVKMSETIHSALAESKTPATVSPRKLTGNFALIGTEVQDVIRALRSTHRSDGDPQPHAHRRAEDHLYALLGQRRRDTRDRFVPRIRLSDRHLRKRQMLFIQVGLFERWHKFGR